MFFYYPFDTDGPLDDKTRLDRFLEDTESFLSRLVFHKRAFVESLYDDVVDAWTAAKVRFSRARQALQTVGHGSLEKAGLTGAELKLKLRNIEHFFGELLSSVGGTTLRSFLDTIDSLLKSLAEAIGVGTALEEIKDAIRDAFAWARA